MCIEADTVAPGHQLLRKERALLGRETGGKAQICLPDPVVAAKFQGLGEFQTWKLIG